jgi:Heterokaryon incompatibility protein (HET)
MRTCPSYLQGILITTLPQTIQDAILVTRRLGLRYLWVDSLCIIQDLEEDKLEQLGRMHAIYSNSYVTIAACSAANCDEGFLQTEKFHTEEQEPSTIPFGTNGGHITFQKYIDPFLDLRIGEGNPMPLKTESINTRAWTFQEQYLSRRILFFSKTLVFWQCCELAGKGGPRVREYYLGQDISRRTLREPTVGDWKDVVHQYSTRNMSDPIDKLPALSSIMTYFASRTNSHYVAGICVAELPYQLCWERCLAGDSSSRPKAWRAPSWSWACVNNAVRFTPQNECKFQPSFNTIELGCSVLDCQATPFSDIAPFGQVTSGFIRVRGRILRCQPIYDTSTSWNHKYRLQEFLPAAGQSEGGEIKFDALSKSFFETGWLDGPHQILTSQGSQPWDELVYCLLLCLQKRTVYRFEVEPAHKEVWWPFGLALRRTGDGDFHRIGIFHGNGSSLQAFSEVEPDTIRII